MLMVWEGWKGHVFMIFQRPITNPNKYNGHTVAVYGCFFNLFLELSSKLIRKGLKHGNFITIWKFDA